MRAALFAALVFPAISLTWAAEGDSSGWPHYGGNLGGGQYSTARQIDTGNVAQLVEVWRHHSGGPGVESAHAFSYQANPILAEQRLYTITGSAVVFALDPASGAQIWRFDAALDQRRRYAESANRGVTSWIDPNVPDTTPCRQRILFGTLDARLIALDGATGKPCADFGDNGIVRLDTPVPGETSPISYSVTSPPVVVGDVLIVGSSIGDNRGVDVQLGIVRGFDVRTGAERWRWDPIPRDATDPAASDWQPTQRARARAANAWPPLAADAALGVVYVPTGSPSPDFYGGERLGNNRYANSLVALKAQDGTVIWSRQLVHHDVWDYDLPAQPALVELLHNGERVPAVLQITKMGLLFTFDRRSGEPVFPLEERAVPRSDVVGEQLSPTQPFPSAPPPLVRTDALTEDDAWGVAYFDRLGCQHEIGNARSEGIFTPPSLRGSLLFPGWAGGANWGGVAYAPESQLAVAFLMDLPMRVTLLPRAEFERERMDSPREGSEYAPMLGTPFGLRREPFLSILGIPCVAPPWGQLVAVDMTTGRIEWKRPLGTTAGVLPKWLPELEFGMPGIGGPIVTAGGLIFIGATLDNQLRALDLKTGQLLWQHDLPAGGQATPMTYMYKGRQYVVIAAGGHSKFGDRLGDALVAFALP